MSIRLMTKVWDETDLEGTDLLVMLCLADHANDENDGECWPSVGRIAQRTRRSERVIQKSMQRLERKGHVRRDLRPGRSNLYHVTPVTRDAPSEMHPVTSDTPTPVTSDTTPPSPVTPRTVIEPPPRTAPDLVVKEVVNSLDDPSVEQTIPNSESLERPSPLPLVRRRQLMNAGVTPEQGVLWEQAWATVTSMQWPDGMEMEAEHYPDEHLAQHIFQALERGYPLSPSRWVQFFITDRQRQIEYARQRIEQMTRIAEDPAEREARQNRHLPPDRTDLDPPATPLHSGVQG